MVEGKFGQSEQDADACAQTVVAPSPDSPPIACGKHRCVLRLAPELRRKIEHRMRCEPRCAVRGHSSEVGLMPW